MGLLFGALLVHRISLGAAVAGPWRCGLFVLESVVALGVGRGGWLSVGAVSLAGVRVVCLMLVVSVAGFSRRFGP